MQQEAQPVGELALAGARLADAVETAMPGWVTRSVARLLVAWSGSADPAIMAEAAAAGRRAAEEVGPLLRRLLAADIDEQGTNPLSLIRGAIGHPTAVLRAAGVPEVVRDRYDEENFPDDVYGLTPARFSDVDPSLEELGIVWGAQKARAHIRRHRSPR